jgi:hypothetical protein
MRYDVMPAFEILPGAADSPVILHVPHASRHVPTAVRTRLLLDDAELEAELDHMTDADTGRRRDPGGGCRRRVPRGCS